MKPGCKNPVMKRGLCKTHYQAIWRLVTQEKATWDEMVKLGFCKIEARLPRVDSRNFSAAILASVAAHRKAKK